MDVLDHLIGEHRKAEQLVARLETTKTRAERQPVVAELGHALATHMEVEERRVYPMIEEHLGEDKATGAEAEHDKARDGLAKLTEVIDQPAFGAALGEFKGNLAHHVTEEETNLFPALRTRASSEIAALGDAEEVEEEVQEEVDEAE